MTVVQVEIQGGLWAIDGGHHQAGLGTPLMGRPDTAVVQMAVDRKRQQVNSTAEVKSQPLAGGDFLVDEGCHETFVDVVVADGRELLAPGRVPQFHMDVVIAGLAADGGVEHHRTQVVHDAIADSAAVDDPAIDLFDLVAADWIVEQKGEIREQIEAVAGGVGQRAQLTRFGGAQPQSREDLMAGGVAALARIEGAETVDESLLDRAGGDLARAVPVSRVAHLAHGERRCRADGHSDLVPQLVSVPSVGVVERAVAPSDLSGEGRLDLIELGAGDRQGAIPSFAVSRRIHESRAGRAVFEIVA